MQQSIVDKAARRRCGSFWAGPKRLPASAGSDRPRGSDRAVLSKTCGLRAAGVPDHWEFKPPRLVLAKEALLRTDTDPMRLPGMLSAVGGVLLVYPSWLVFISVAIGFGPQWLADRSLAMLADGAEEGPLPSARRRQSR